MNIKKINTICGYGYYILGAVKIIFFILLVLNIVTNVSIIMRGGNANTDNNQQIFMIIGFAEIGLAIVSFIMQFANLNKEPSISGGYALGIVAVLLEFILPSGILIFAIFSQCAIFMKAGQMIVKNNEKLPDKIKPKERYKTGNTNNIKTTSTIPEEPLNNTDWFYMDSRTDNKEELRAKKLKEELEEWKKLLDSGDIDQETYNIETNKLIQKEQKRLREKNSRLW